MTCFRLVLQKCWNDVCTQIFEFFWVFWKNLQTSPFTRQITFSRSHVVPILSDFWQSRFLYSNGLSLTNQTNIQALKKSNVKNMLVAFLDLNIFPPCFSSFFLFFCCYQTRKSLLILPPWAWSKTPGSVSTRAAKLFLRSYQRYTIARRHSMRQLKWTFYKLTGWLASLDLRKLYTRCILSHRIVSQDPPRLIS